MSQHQLFATMALDMRPRDGEIRYGSHAIDEREALWIRQQAHARRHHRGIYRALAEALSVERFAKGRPAVKKNAVYAAAIGNTWKYLPIPPVKPDPNRRPRKLSPAKVREIVRLLDQESPKLTVVEIARRFNVSQVAITKINLGQTHAWATRDQAISSRIRHKQTTLSKADNLCMIRCAADREWWTYDLLAEIFGMTSGMAVMHRLRAARKRHTRSLGEGRRLY